MGSSHQSVTPSLVQRVGPEAGSVTLWKLLKEKDLKRGERSFLTARVSSGCQDKIPQTGGLKQQEFISHSSGVQDQGTSRFGEW